MKKLFALLLSILTIFGMVTFLSSCGKSSNTDNKTSSVSEKGERKEKTKSDISKDKDEDMYEDSDNAFDEDVIIGTWEITVDFIKMVKATNSTDPDAVELANLDLDDPNIKFLFTFKEDGSGKCAYEEKSLKKFYKAYIEAAGSEGKRDISELDDADSLTLVEYYYRLEDNRIILLDKDDEDQKTWAIFTYKVINKNKIKVTDAKEGEHIDYGWSAVLPMVWERV